VLRDRQPEKMAATDLGLADAPKGLCGADVFLGGVDVGNAAGGKQRIHLFRVLAQPLAPERGVNIAELVAVSGRAVFGLIGRRRSRRSWQP